jgi:hypothetical protein
MIDLSAKRNRYMRDPLPVRLGGLAANLARMNSFSDNQKHDEAVSKLLNECRYFIEWVGKDADLDVQIQLLALQRELTRWRHSWEKIWTDSERRLKMAKESEQWSETMLKLAGLN